MSRQAYGLRTKILEVDRWVEATSMDVREVHPEVSFATIAGRALTRKKKSWAGACEHRTLLAEAGIDLADDLGEAGVQEGYDDVLDAAAAAWSALRIVAGQAMSLPVTPELDTARAGRSPSGPYQPPRRSGLLPSLHVWTRSHALLVAPGGVPGCDWVMRRRGRNKTRTAMKPA